MEHMINRRWHLTKANLEETKNEIVLTAIQKLQEEAEAKDTKIDFNSIEGQNALIRELTDKVADPEREVLLPIGFDKHPALAAAAKEFQQNHPEFDLGTFAGQRKFLEHVGDLAFEKAETEFLKNDDGTRFSMTFFMGPYNLASNEDRIQHELSSSQSLTPANTFQVSTGNYFDQLLETLGLQNLPQEEKNLILNQHLQHQTGEGARYVMQEKAMGKGYPINYFLAGQYYNVPGGLSEQFAEYSQKGYRLNAVYLTANKRMIDNCARNFGLRVARGTAWLSTATALKCVEDDRFHNVKFVYLHDKKLKAFETIACKRNWKLEVYSPTIFKEHVIDRGNSNPHTNPFSLLRNQKYFNPKNPVENYIQQEADMRESLKSEQQRQEELALSRRRKSFPSNSVVNGLHIPVVITLNK